MHPRYSIAYKLDNNVPVRCSLAEYSEWDKTHSRKLFSNVENGFLISTVFLGMDLGFDGTPQFFETMLFKIIDDAPCYGAEAYTDRYETYEQAKSGHEYARRYAKCLVLI